jgi:hypothetical protein
MPRPKFTDVILVAILIALFGVIAALNKSKSSSSEHPPKAKKQ